MGGPFGLQGGSRGQACVAQSLTDVLAVAGQVDRVSTHLLLVEPTTVRPLSIFAGRLVLEVPQGGICFWKRAACLVMAFLVDPFQRCLRKDSFLS